MTIFDNSKILFKAGRDMASWTWSIWTKLCLWWQHWQCGQVVTTLEVRSSLRHDTYLTHEPQGGATPGGGAGLAGEGVQVTGHIVNKPSAASPPPRRHTPPSCPPSTPQLGFQPSPCHPQPCRRVPGWSQGRRNSPWCVPVQGPSLAGYAHTYHFPVFKVPTALPVTLTRPPRFNAPWGVNYLGEYRQDTQETTHLFLIWELVPKVGRHVGLTTRDFRR